MDRKNSIEAKKEQALQDLQNKVWFRLVTVVYGIGVATVISLAIFTFYLEKPYSYIDKKRSYISCLDKTRYRVSDLNGSEFYNLGDKFLKGKDVDRAYELCSDHLVDASQKLYGDLTMDEVITKARGAGIPDEYTMQRVKQDLLKQHLENNTPIYDLRFIETTRSSWNQAMRRTLIVGAISWIALEIIKRVFLYIVLGKKIDVSF